MPQTKQMLFPDAQLRSDLDNFFRVAKNMADNPNPSGTAHNLLLVTQAGLVWQEPVTGAVSVIGGGALSKLLMLNLTGQRKLSGLIRSRT